MKASVRMSRQSLFETAPQALPVLLGVSIFVLMVVSGSALLNDPDTYWHIALGRWILENHAVPGVDPFSHTMPGAPWHAHEWAAGLLLAAAHAFAGWAGVVLVAAAAIGLTFGIFAWGLSVTLRPVYVLVLTVLALMGLSAHLLARPHIVVLPVLTLWTVLMVFARAGGRRPPLWAALLMVPWANMHGSFPIGLGLAGLLALEAFFEERSGQGRVRVIRDWGLFLTLSTLAAFVTPFGLQGFLFPFQIGGMEKSFKWIMEWHPQDFSRPSPLEAWLMVMLAVALYRGLRIPPFRLVLCLGLLHLTLAHARMADYLILIVPLLLCPLIAAQWPDAPAGSAPAPLSRGMRLGGAAALALIVLAAAAMLAGSAVAPSEDKSPVAALAAARQAPFFTEPVFNDYNFGGYLIFERVPTFIDGRADMYGDDFLDRALTAASDPLAKPDLADLLEKYRIGWTLFHADDVAARLMDTNPDWVEFYRDDVAVIHVPTAQADRN